MRRCLVLVAAVVAAILIVACGSGASSTRVTVSPYPLYSACASTDCGSFAATMRWGPIRWAHTTTGYNVMLDGSQIATTTGLSYTYTGMDCGTTFTLGVQAHDSSSDTSSTISTSYTTPNCPPAAPHLPSGVTLQAIDGGSCSTSTGPCSGNYYCSNGYTYACNGGWDNPSFFPILQDYAFHVGDSTSSFFALGLNGDVRVTGGTSSPADVSSLRTAGVWLIQARDTSGTTDDSINTGSETVGGHVEEPGTWDDVASDTTAEDSGSVDPFGLTGRFIQMSLTWDAMYYGTINAGTSGTTCSGGGSTMTIVQAMACTSGIPHGMHVGFITDDIYWFATQAQTPSGGNGPWACGYIYNINTGSTYCSQAQTAEASHYGDMIDVMRYWTTNNRTGAPATMPTAAYVESNGNSGGGSVDINPAELEWADLDVVIHGARALYYFTGDRGDFGFNTTDLSGFTISDATQASDTNGLVENLAPIINAPFALNYASSSNGGYTFPTPASSNFMPPGCCTNSNFNIGTGNQVDLMTKYYTGGSFSNSSGTFGDGFYIFVTGRGEETTTNVPVTLTLPSSVSNQTVNVIDSAIGAPTSTTASVSSHQISFTMPNDYDTYIIGPIGN